MAGCSVDKFVGQTSFRPRFSRPILHMTRAMVFDTVVCVRENFLNALMRIRLIFKAFFAINTFLKYTRLLKEVEWIKLLSTIEWFTITLKTLTPLNQGFKFFIDLHNCFYTSLPKDGEPFWKRASVSPKTLCIRAIVFVTSIVNIFIAVTGLDIFFSISYLIRDSDDFLSERAKLKLARLDLEAAKDALIEALEKGDKDPTVANLNNIETLITAYHKAQKELEEQRGKCYKSVWDVAMNVLSLVSSIIFVVNPVIGACMKAVIALLRVSHMILNMVVAGVQSYLKNSRALKLAATASAGPLQTLTTSLKPRKTPQIFKMQPSKLTAGLRLLHEEEKEKLLSSTFMTVSAGDRNKQKTGEALKSFYTKVKTKVHAARSSFAEAGPPYLFYDEYCSEAQETEAKKEPSVQSGAIDVVVTKKAPLYSQNLDTLVSPCSLVPSTSSSSDSESMPSSLGSSRASSFSSFVLARDSKEGCMGEDFYNRSVSPE